MNDFFQQMKLDELIELRHKIHRFSLNQINEMFPSLVDIECPSSKTVLNRFLEFFASDDLVDYEMRSDNKLLLVALKKSGLSSYSTAVHDELRHASSYSTLLFGITLGYSISNMETLAKDIQIVKRLLATIKAENERH